MIHNDELVYEEPKGRYYSRYFRKAVIDSDDDIESLRSGNHGNRRIDSKVILPDGKLRVEYSYDVDSGG